MLTFIGRSAAFPKNPMRNYPLFTLGLAWLWLSGLLLLGVSQWAPAQEPRINLLEQRLPAGPATNQWVAPAPVAARPAAPQVDELNDLGPELALYRQPRPKWFDVSSDTQYAYNSNINLAPHAALGDGVLVETLALAVSPVLRPGLTSTVYVRQQFIRYNNHDVFDFNAQTAGLALSYPVHDWCAVYGGFAGSRLIVDKYDTEFYREYDTVFGVWRQQQLGSRVVLYYGYQLDWLPTNMPTMDRVYNALYGGLNVPLADQVLAQLLYRFQVQTYLGDDRTDWNHLVNLAVTYTFNRWIAARAFASSSLNTPAGVSLDWVVI